MFEVIQKPLYTRIQEYLTKLILSGNLTPQQIQSKREISEDLGVSRMTVRRALTELVNEGLLERRHGSGTCVTKPRVTYEAHEMVDFLQASQERSIATASQLIEFGEIAANRRLAELMDIEIGNPIYRVIILHFTNRVPVFLERGSFPCSRCPGLEKWDLEKSSIYDLLTTVYRLKPGRISQTVEAVAATNTVAHQLRVEEGFPLITLSRTVYNPDTKKPEFSQNFLRTDYAHIRTDLFSKDSDE